MKTLLFSLLLLGASKGGVNMPDTVTVEGTKLLLNGLGIREATVFNVDVYVAGLYVEKKSKNASAILSDKGKKKLVLQFVRDVDQSDLTKAWKEGFAKNGGKALKKELAQLNRYMRAMKSGQKLELTYVPEKGTTVTVNGKAKGTIAGDAFAGVMWKIFIGPNPPNKGLKSGLLGG